MQRQTSLRQASRMVVVAKPASPLEKQSLFGDATRLASKGLLEPTESVCVT